MTAARLLPLLPLLALFALFALAAPLPAAAIITDEDYSNDVTCETKTYDCECDGKSTGVSAAKASDCASVCEPLGAENYELVCKSLSGATLSQGGGAVSASSSSSEPPLVDLGTVKGGNAIATPNLIVDIPGVDFSEAVGYDADGKLRVNYVGAYVNGVYRFLIPAMALVAVVMLMVSGLQYILAHGNVDIIKKAKERMNNAVVGLILLLAAYNIAFVINPDFLVLSGVGIEIIKNQPLEFADTSTDYGEAEEIDASKTVAMKTEGHLTVTAEEKLIGTEVYEKLKTAADALYKSNALNITVSSGSRTMQKQAELYYDNCVAKSCGTPTCNPAKGKVSASDLSGKSRTEAIASIVANGDAGKCNHTNNVAVDIWPQGSGEGFRFDVSDMNAMTAAMKTAGFCRLDSEPWHFELAERGSSTCTSHSDSSYTRNKKPYSTAGCARWDADMHRCMQKETTQ